MGRRHPHPGHRLGLSASRAAPRFALDGRPHGHLTLDGPLLLGLAGWSGSGKTTLLEAILPRLRAHGLTISTIKHAHHGLDLDRPGKDSFRHREAGATEVLVVGGARWALLRETGWDRTGETPDLQALAARLAPVDLILVEGFKADPIPKIEIHRPILGKPALWPSVPGIQALATDAEGRVQQSACPHPLLDLDDPATIADWILPWTNARLTQA